MIRTIRQLLPQNMTNRTLAIVASVIAVQFSLVPLTTQVAWADPLLLEKPVLITPAKDSWSKSTSNDFAWNAVDGTTKYEVRYGNNASCATDPADTDPTHAGQFAGANAFVVETTDTHKTIDGLIDGQWCWQVRAVKTVLHAADIKSEWSDIWNVKTDTSVPVLTIGSGSSPLNFKGTVSGLGATLVVVIDGADRLDIPVIVATSPNTLGTYDWELTLPEGLEAGDHKLQVRATDAAGNTAITAEQAFTAKELVVTEPEGIDPNITQTATLPLVPVGPLIFVAPTPAPIESSPAADTTIVPVADDSVSRSELPEAVLAASLSPTLNGHSPTQAPVQATGQGWALFGVTWYWWLLGTGVATVGWSLVARWRLASRLG